MAKVRLSIADWLGQVGKKVFGFLTRCEDRQFMPGLSKGIKVGLLGFFVTVISSLSAEDRDDIILCYKPMLTYPYVSDVRITPSPTNGADSVTLSAIGRIHNDYMGDHTIDSAFCVLGTDTLTMIPVDTVFGDTAENVLARLYVAGLQPGTTRVDIIVIDNTGYFGTEIENLIVTEKEEEQE